MTLDELAVVVPLGPGERAWRGCSRARGAAGGARVVLVATAAEDLPRATIHAAALQAELVALVRRADGRRS
jgi:hypothetical protein